MKRALKSVLYLVLLLPCGTPAYPQTVGTASTSTFASGASPLDLNTDCFGGTVKDIKQRFSEKDKPGAKRDIQRWFVYVCYLTADPLIRTQLLGKAEQNRLDKQPGATSNSSGTTSLVSKGSSPWLLGFALEHGGLTQSTDGNTITFRGNVANSIRALLNSTYLGSYQLGEKDHLVAYLAKLSFGVSFDTSSNQPSSSQGFSPNTHNFSGFSAKYEIRNHRDPRDKKWRRDWNKLAADLGLPIAKSLGDLDSIIIGHLERENPLYSQWKTTTFNAIDALPDNPSVEQIQKVVQDAADLFHRLFWDLPEVKNAVDHLAARTLTYFKEEDDILSNMRHSTLVTVEYNFTRQLTTNNQNITATQPRQQIPDLSNINLVLEKGIQGANAPEFTFNAGVTLFNSTDSTNPTRGRVRDYRASAQFDVPLKEITNIGRPVLSFSGQFLALLEEPLGQKVMLNGVTIDRRGNIGVFQTKLSIPVKDSGVKIPISFTYATRTELVKEKDTRGNIGITLDLDTLFSKAK